MIAPAKIGTVRLTPDPVGAGLLAKAECQSTSMLNVRSHSRASPLPQGGMFLEDERALSGERTRHTVVQFKYPGSVRSPKAFAAL
ncbi:hypothetical protein C2E19_14560 [Pseudomonas sp. DTU12.3]|nr:hypothetical protein C2E19_14560 [Pseudomonas sp. DTU12.3]